MKTDFAGEAVVRLVSAALSLLTGAAAFALAYQLVDD
jgi:hypothetical protein